MLSPMPIYVISLDKLSKNLLMDANTASAWLATEEGKNTVSSICPTETRLTSARRERA